MYKASGFKRFAGFYKDISVHIRGICIPSSDENILSGNISLNQDICFHALSLLIEISGNFLLKLHQLIPAGKLCLFINLIINIVPWSDHEIYDRLGLENQYVELLGVKVPSITIPVTPGRNLAVNLEVAAMNNRQKRMGYNAAVEFTEQINRHFDQAMNE